MRLIDYLHGQRVSFRTLLHAPAFSPCQRARALHVEPARVAQALLLHGPRGFFVHVLPATHNTDLEALSRLWGGEVRLARKDEAAAIFRDCSWGVVSAFGNLYGLWTLLDRSISADTWVVLEAGTAVDSILMAAYDFERLSRAFGVTCARPISTPLGNGKAIVCNRPDES